MVGAFRGREPDASRLVIAAVRRGAGGRHVPAGRRSTRARPTTFGGQFVTDRFAVYLKVLTLLGAALCLIMSPEFLRDEGIERFEFPVLALFSTVGMLMMISANSLLALYLALELQSLPLYVMTAFHRDQTRSTEAGLKYFVLGALASGLLLYGCSLVYGFTGTLSFERPGAAVRSRRRRRARRSTTGALIGLVFIAAGLAFKLAAVPFHMWTPDVYEGAPTPVTAFLAAAPKVAAIGLTLRVFYQPFGDWAAEWQQIVVFISVASMLLGAFAAIGQTNIKRLLAYSSIGHIGYALVGLAAGTADGRLERADLHGDLRGHDRRHLRLRAADAAQRPGGREHRRSRRARPHPAACSPRRSRSSCSRWPASRRSPASSPSSTCSSPRSMPAWSRSR